jgi:hypothetical protein
MDYSRAITGIVDLPKPKKFSINLKSQNQLDEKIGGLPADWLLSDKNLYSRLSHQGLSMAYVLYGTSSLGITTRNKVGRMWNPTGLNHVRWAYRVGPKQPLLLQPAFAALQDDRKTTASERARNGLTQMYQGSLGGTDTQRLAGKIAKLLNGNYNDTNWLMRLAYYYCMTAFAEATTGQPIGVSDAKQETLISTYTQAGFAGTLTEVIQNRRDVIYLDSDSSIVDDELIAVATYIANPMSINFNGQTLTPNLPRLNNPVVLVQGREAGIVRSQLNRIEHGTVTALVQHYVTTMNCPTAFEQALKTISFLMMKPSLAASYRESYVVPNSDMAAGVAGYLLTGPASVASYNLAGPIIPAVHSMYEGVLRRMIFETTLNTLRHGAGVHHLTAQKGRPIPTIAAAWEKLLSTGRGGGYAAALDQLAAMAGWPNALGALLADHGFTTTKVHTIFDAGWARRAVQWAELLPWVQNYPTQAAVLAKLAPVKLVSALIGTWQPVAEIAGREDEADGFLTLMMEASSARIAVRILADEHLEFIEVARITAVSTGWQSDFSIPAITSLAQGVATLRARIDDGLDLVNLMAAAKRPETTWKLEWHIDPLTVRNQDEDDNVLLHKAIREAEVARTAMSPEAIQKSKEEAAVKAEAGALAQRIADDSVQIAIMMSSHLPQYKDLPEQYESMVRLGADLTRSGLFMDAVRKLAQTLDEIDHIEAVKAIDPNSRTLVIEGLVTLCDNVAQAAETAAIRTNLGRMASGMRSIAAQLSDDPTLSLDELKGATERELEAYMAGLENAVLSETDAQAAQAKLIELILSRTKAAGLSGPMTESALRSQLSSGGNAQAWLQAQETTAELIAAANLEADAAIKNMHWSVATTTPQELAREAAANGHNDPALAEEAVPPQIEEDVKQADFALGQSVTEAGLVDQPGSTTITAPMVTESESSQPMVFTAIAGSQQ